MRLIGVCKRQNGLKSLCHIDLIETDNKSTLKPSILRPRNISIPYFTASKHQNVENPFEVSQCYLPQSNKSDAVLQSTLNRLKSHPHHPQP